MGLRQRRAAEQARSLSCLAAIIFVSVLLFAGQVARADAPRPSATPSPSASPADDAAEWTSLYALLLKSPARLGCKLDRERFDKVYETIRGTHVDNPTEAALMGGVVDEARYVFRAARLPEDALRGLTLDASLPRRLMDASAGRVDASVLCFAMIRGLCRGTGDRFTYFLLPAQFRRISQSLNSKTLVGFGLQLDVDNAGKVIGLDRMEGSPAQKAGLLPDDHIVRVNEHLTAGMTEEEVAGLLGGPYEAVTFGWVVSADHGWVVSPDHRWVVSLSLWISLHPHSSVSDVHLHSPGPLSGA